MSPRLGMAAIVLAAGRSSRMGTSKPLLPLGSATVIERLVAAVSRAGVGDIVVVTGHDSDALVPLLDGLPVRHVHNAGYDSGMFSSVRTGAKALGDRVEAFFVLPADYPLVRTEVLDRLTEGFREGEHGILHPSCRGLHGHPPLLSGRYRDALAEADDGDDLRSFLQRRAEDEGEVEVQDLTVLMDMDTSEDYQRICRFAAILDAATGVRAAAVTPEDALYLLSLLEVPGRVIRHCQTVAVVGRALAEALKPRVPELDVDLVHAACLLHDMAKGERGHALFAESILRNLGLERLGAIVGTHIVLPPEKLDVRSVTEEHLLYIADKLVVDDNIGTLEERAERTLRKRNHSFEALQVVQARMLIAQTIRERIESILDRPLEEVLPRQRQSSI
jgi:molybdenum cofactor cytidylyltransferase